MAFEQEPKTIYIYQSVVVLDEKPRPILNSTEFEKKYFILEFTEDFLILSGRTYKILTDLPVGAYRLVKIFGCEQSFLHERVQTTVTHKRVYLIVKLKLEESLLMKKNKEFVWIARC